MFIGPLHIQMYEQWGKDAFMSVYLLENIIYGVTHANAWSSKQVFFDILNQS